MNQLSNQHITCPYCGENIELVIDCSIPEQEYIEDCEVCCRPINLLTLLKRIKSMLFLNTKMNRQLFLIQDSRLDNHIEISPELAVK